MLGRLVRLIYEEQAKPENRGQTFFGRDAKTWRPIELKARAGPSVSTEWSRATKKEPSPGSQGSALVGEGGLAAHLSHKVLDRLWDVDADRG